MENYLDVANSGFMFLLCLIPVCVILIQTILFFRLAWEQGKEIGLDEKKMKQCVRSSATFSIIPSLTLVTLLVALSVTLGKFFPWLRLSNIGAGAYEAVAAEIGFSATGAQTYADLTLAGFITIMMTMNPGMSVAPVNTLLTLKSYDKTLKKARKTNPFITIGTSAAFIGIISRLSVPHYINFNAKLGVVAAFTGAIVMWLCHYLGKFNSKFKEFGLSLGIIAGVLMCILVSHFGIV